MNSIDEKLLRYFENEMDPDERKEFEIELHSNPGLMNNLQNFRSVTNSFQLYKEIKTDERYFNNIISEFNIRKGSVEKKSWFDFIFRPVYILPGIASILVLISVFVLLNRTNNILVTPQGVVSELQENEITDALSIYHEDYYTSDKIVETVPDSAFNNYFYAEISENPQSIKEYISKTTGYTGTDDVNYKNLSEEEVDKIYSELINKKIL